MLLIFIVLSDERKEMEKIIIQNGGKYSAELTKKCTHLISDISFLWFLWEKCRFLDTCIIFYISYYAENV